MKNISQTNTRYPNYYQEIFTAGDEEQFEIRKKSLIKSVSSIQDNIFKAHRTVIPWEGYRNLNSRSVINTFQYIFHKLKKGIFIQIRDNELENFLPFSNAAFKNDWSHLIKVDPKYSSVKEFLDYTSKLAGYNPSDINPTNRWFANNALVRYENTRREVSNNLGVLNDMFRTLCRERSLPDIDFFLNKRDFPILTRDGTEPYNHLYSSRSVPMEKQYDLYAPIFSVSSIPNMYADILIPTYEDWMRVVYQNSGKIFPNEGKAYPKIEQTPWHLKIKKAVFRGSSTGAGTREETNKRLRALQISEQNTDILDVGITKWNTRPRNHESEVYLQTIERDVYPISRKLTPQEQSEYAYILHIEGHVAAFRLSYELSFGSVILMVDSDWKLWFSRMLMPWVHYVPVKSDLSDLIEKVQWCKENDNKCVEIAKEALEFYNTYLSMNGVLDYLQKTFIDTTNMTGKYTYMSDILSYQLMEEEECNRENILHSLSWVRRNKSPTYPIHSGERNVNTLRAYLLLLHGSPKKVFIRQIFSSAKSVINLAQVGLQTVVEKNARTKNAIKENIHEVFIGLNVTNKLNIPNFAHVFGPRVTKEQFSCETVYIEFIHGPTLEQWLRSRDFSFPKLLNILVQLNMALQVAQNEYGFIHYDLYPWNIILVKLEKPKEYAYKVKHKLTLKFRTSLIPVMIDFGKSRGVVYDKKMDIVKDYGYVDLYNGTMIIDTLTILISCLSIVEHQLSPDVVNNFRHFFDLAGVTDCCDNLYFYKKYGKLFGLRDTRLTPMNFVNYVISNFGKMRELKVTTESVNFVCSGNPLVYYFTSVYGSNEIAVRETLKRIALHTFPRAKTDVGKRYLKEVTLKETAWLDIFISKIQDRKTQKTWIGLKKLLLEGINKKPSEMFDFSIPPITSIISLDSSMTPDEVIESAGGIEFVTGDLINTLKAYDEMYSMNMYESDIDASIKNIPVPFIYISNVARGNSLLWMNNLI